MIKCCKWKPSGQIVVGKCDPVSPNCTPGFFVTAEELERREREAFDAGRQGTYIINDIISNNLHMGKVQASFTFQDFNDYLSSKSKEGKNEAE